MASQCQHLKYFQVEIVGPLTTFCMAKKKTQIQPEKRKPQTKSEKGGNRSPHYHNFGLDNQNLWEKFYSFIVMKSMNWSDESFSISNFLTVLFKGLSNHQTVIDVVAMVCTLMIHMPEVWCHGEHIEKQWGIKRWGLMDMIRSLRALLSWVNLVPYKSLS